MFLDYCTGTHGTDAHLELLLLALLQHADEPVAERDVQQYKHHKGDWHSCASDRKPSACTFYTVYCSAGPRHCSQPCSAHVILLWT